MAAEAQPSPKGSSADPAVAGETLSGDFGGKRLGPGLASAAAPGTAGRSCVTSSDLMSIYSEANPSNHSVFYLICREPSKEYDFMPVVAI